MWQRKQGRCLKQLRSKVSILIMLIAISKAFFESFALESFGGWSWKKFQKIDNKIWESELFFGETLTNTQQIVAITVDNYNQKACSIFFACLFSPNWCIIPCFEESKGFFVPTLLEVGGTIFTNDFLFS